MMYQRIFLGNEIIHLDHVDSTNTHLKELLLKRKKIIEGLVIVADEQVEGKGQMDKKWLSDPLKNLTFSIFLTPKIKVSDQFLIAKVIALGMVDFLNHLQINNVRVKWPNDIYVGDTKIAGVLIENSVKTSIIENSIIGIGLNINQVLFDKKIPNPTSIKLIKEKDFDLKTVLKQLLFFLEKRYLMLKKSGFKVINEDYKKQLYRLNELKKFEINKKIIQAKIIGVTSEGKLNLRMVDSENSFDLKEVKFII